jgi:hypothetical protein
MVEHDDDHIHPDEPVCRELHLRCRYPRCLSSRESSEPSLGVTTLADKDGEDKALVSASTKLWRDLLLV